jgi:hypothetical protein
VSDPDPHTDAPESEADVRLIRQAVHAQIRDAANLSIQQMERAKGGLQYLTPDTFNLYAAALRALDQLHLAVK